MKNRLKKYKRITKLQIISLSLITIAFFLRIFNIYNNDYFFIGVVALNMLSLLKYMEKWSNEGKTWFKRIDKKYDKNFTRTPSDLLFFMVTGYVLIIVLVILISNFINKGFNDYVFAMYLLTIVCNYMALSVVDRTSNNVERFIDDSGKGKIKVERKRKNG